MVLRSSVCVRRLGGGQRSQEMRFGRYLANDKVTVERLIEGWSEQTAPAAADRHVLAIQDTSEINFSTTAARDRKSTRLNSSHSQISYAVFCLKKKRQLKTKYPHSKKSWSPSNQFIWDHLERRRRILYPRSTPYR